MSILKTANYPKLDRSLRSFHCLSCVLVFFLYETLLPLINKNAKAHEIFAEKEMFLLFLFLLKKQALLFYISRVG